MNIQEERAVEIKRGKQWVISHIDTKPIDIYKALATDLLAKKIHNCSWIKRIEDSNNYDGTRTIKITYDNDCRSIYTIASH